MSLLVRIAKGGCGLLLLVALVVGGAQAGSGSSVDEIQRAIEERGAHWEARETSVFRLPAEERRRLCGAQLYLPVPEEISPPPGVFPGTAMLTSLDWRNYNGHDWTTAIRDQGGCGSCVAFGCMAAFEACMSIVFNAPEPTFDLSEQHIFSCGGGSCEYGWNVPAALNYLKEHGAPDEDCYPYRAMDNRPPDYGAPCGESCQDWQIRARKAADWGWVTSYSEEAIKTALMNSPLPVYITVYSDFFAYSSGVYERVSDQVEGGHIVCMVGWDDDQNCWICKNSWGRDWGEEGWFRIRKGTNESDIEASVAWVVPLPAEYPKLEFHAYMAQDSVGDGDGVVNPGETATLRLGVENKQTWATATSLSASLSSIDSRVTIHDPVATYEGDILSGQIGWNDLDEFTISVENDIGVCEIPLSVDITAMSGRLPAYQTSFDFNLLVSYDQYGWPADVSAPVRSAPLIEDLDGDGHKEVVAIDYSGSVHVWNRLGQELPGFCTSVEGNIWSSPAMGDVDADGEPEIVFGSSNAMVYAVADSGSLLFSREVDGSVLSTPTLADLNGDGHLETIVGTLNGLLYVLKDDGSDYDPFPISLSDAIFAAPAVAPLDDDGLPDIVVASLGKSVYALSSGSGQTLPGFPVATGGMLASAPSLADLDGNGDNEIIIGCDDGDIYVIDHLGQVRFTVSSGQMVRSSPAIGDLDGDDQLDIVFASKNGKVYAVNAEGSVLSGWPFQAEGFIESSPAIADMDGDNLPEVIFGTAAEKLYILSGDGTLREQYPTPPTGAIYSSPHVDDLDGDGDFEIALGTPSGLSIWDYKLATNSHRPWPMFRGNSRRTGYYADNITTVVSRSSESQKLPKRYALDQNYPNPFNAETQIRFSLPEDVPVTLEIFNIVGQKVVGLARGQYAAGMHRVSWDGKDSAGALVASGIYFYRLQAEGFRETRRMVLLR